VIPLSLETIQTRVIRRPRCRKIAGRHDAKARDRGAAFIGLHRPSVCPAVKGCLVDAGVELDVAPEIEAVRHVVDVTQDLGLRAVALGPTPFLLQFVREGIRVLHAFDIAATSGVAVPVPGAANPAAGLECMHFEAEFTQTMDRVEAAHPSADDDRIKPRRF